MRHKTPKLSPLLFKDLDALHVSSLSQLTDRVREVVPNMVTYEKLGSQPFQSKIALAEIGELALSAVSASPTRMRVDGVGGVTFIFQAVGRSEFRCEGNSFLAAPEQSAVLIPAESCVDITSQQRSGVLIRVDPHRLGSTAEIMMGERCRQAVLSRINQPIQIDFQQSVAGLNQTFRHYFGLVDSLLHGKTLLQHSGLQDVFYRLMVFSLAPQECLHSSDNSEQEFSRRRLSRACEYVMANLSNPINLTDLERIGHMSRRTLHNAFVKAYGLSPIEWVREQRLLLAYTLLSNSANKVSVTSVMLRCGYASPSLFSLHYVRRFGERPSETASLKRKAA